MLKTCTIYRSWLRRCLTLELLDKAATEEGDLWHRWTLIRKTSGKHGPMADHSI